MNKLIEIEVAYASPQQQVVLNIKIKIGMDINEAIEHSGILKQFPEIDLKTQKVGIFGKVKKLNELVKEGDRIEIYRPLLIDPKMARRAKAKKQKN